MPSRSALVIEQNWSIPSCCQRFTCALTSEDGLSPSCRDAATIQWARLPQRLARFYRHWMPTEPGLFHWMTMTMVFDNGVDR
mmetsp:Transcript_40207/g.129133  ORF Transcript_40207/g.129133 Transcript_40207/m.129133 type:complete len:82 (-) Transcript_40207:275-520(-)